MSFNEDKLKRFFDLYTKELEPKTNYTRRIMMAFIVGGFFCLLGEFLFRFYEKFGFDEIQVRTLGSITMIFIGAILTGIGVYDKIGNVGGAGSIIPITGFSNAVSSPAIEFKKEGVVFGTCVKMFTIAGPVIVFGITSSILVGIIHFLYGKIIG